MDALLRQEALGHRIVVVDAELEWRFHEAASLVVEVVLDCSKSVRAAALVLVAPCSVDFSTAISGLMRLAGLLPASISFHSLIWASCSSVGFSIANSSLKPAHGPAGVTSTPRSRARTSKSVDVGRILVGLALALVGGAHGGRSDDVDATVCQCLVHVAHKALGRHGRVGGGVQRVAKGHECAALRFEQKRVNLASLSIPCAAVTCVRPEHSSAPVKRFLGGGRSVFCLAASGPICK